MRMTIHKVQSRAEYYSDKIVCLSTGDVQNKEIGELVNVIATSSCDCQKLHEIFSEVEGICEGLRGIAEEIWERDVSECKQF